MDTTDSMPRAGNTYGIRDAFTHWRVCEVLWLAFASRFAIGALSIDVMRLTKPSIAVVADSFFQPVYVANPEEFPPSVLQ